MTLAVADMIGRRVSPGFCCESRYTLAKPVAASTFAAGFPDTIELVGRWGGPLKIMSRRSVNVEAGPESVWYTKTVMRVRLQPPAGTVKSSATPRMLVPLSLALNPSEVMPRAFCRRLASAPPAPPPGADTIGPFEYNGLGCCAEAVSTSALASRTARAKTTERTGWVAEAMAFRRDSFESPGDHHLAESRLCGARHQGGGGGTRITMHRRTAAVFCGTRFGWVRPAQSRGRSRRRR